MHAPAAFGRAALVGKGMANDANTVAEYLDNTLSAERVPEFEKICLESDVHLAEVGSCHQILTLVLGEPADIDPDSRDRMYQLINEPPRAASDTPPPYVTPAVGGQPPSGLAVDVAAQGNVEIAKRAKPEVPDYLRESRSRFWPMVAMLLVAATLTLAILSTIGPPGVRQWMNNLIAMNPAVDSVDKTGEGNSDEAADSDSDKAAAGDAAIGDSKVADNDVVAGDHDTRVGDADDRDMDSGEDPPAADMTGDEAIANRTSDVQLPRKTQDVGDDAADAPEPGVKLPFEVDDLPAEPEKVAANAGAAATSDDPLGPAPEPGDDGAPTKVAADKPTAVDPPQPGRELGRYISDRDVLLVFDRANEAWQRLPARAIVAGGDRLLTLPSFRSTIALSSGIAVQASGPSQFEFENPDDRGVPGIAVEFGRISMLTQGKAGNQIRIRMGERVGTLTFGDADAEVALEVRYILVPGKDPETGAGVLAADLFATSGQIRWEEDGRRFLRCKLRPARH